MNSWQNYHWVQCIKYVVRVKNIRNWPFLAPTVRGKFKPTFAYSVSLTHLWVPLLVSEKKLVQKGCRE